MVSIVYEELENSNKMASISIKKTLPKTEWFSGFQSARTEEKVMLENL